uniref:Pentacotripeptide-repeat region of PRORP domain-containing protein n=1 Tax=Anopheles epiroticus TaxID=199890 RepID=A0A182PRI0_9DIPT
MNHLRGALIRRVVVCRRAAALSCVSGAVVLQQHSIPLTRLLSQSVRHCQTVPSAKQNADPITVPDQTVSEPAKQKHPAIDSVRLVEELRSDAIVYRRVQLEKLNKLLAKPFEIPRDAYEFLLQCCGTLLCAETLETRMKVFEQFWFYLGEPKQPAHWKVLLQVYRENERSITDVPAFLASIGEEVEKDAELYRGLMGVLAEKGDIPEMKLVGEMMKERNIPLTVDVINLMIRGYGRAGDLDGVQMVLETMSASSVSATGETYGELMIAFLEDGMADRVLKMVREKGSQLNDKHILELLSLALGDKMQPELVRALLKLLPEEMTSDGRIHPVLRNVLSGLVRAGQLDGMMTLLDELPAPQFRANENTDGYGTFLIVEMLRNDVPFDRVNKFLQKLIKSERNLRAYQVACECAAKAGHPHFSRLLAALAPLEDLRPHYFWPLFMQRTKSDGEAGVLGVLKTMHKLKVEPDQETLTQYVLPKLSLTLKDSRTALKILEDCGVRSAVLMTPFISHLLYQNRFDEVLDLARRYPTKLNTEELMWPLILQANVNRSAVHQRKLSEVICALKDRSVDERHDLGGQLLLELISNKKSKHDANSLRALLTEFDRFGIRISRMAAGVLKNHFGRALKGTPTPDGSGETSDALLKKVTDDQLTILSKELFDTISIHPRDMSYDELECHLVELEQKKLNTRGVLRRLLQLSVREGRYKRALELKQKCDQAKVDQSSGMLASVVELYTKVGDPVQAGRTLEQLRKQFPGFVVDEHKIIDYAALLVERGQLDGAKKVLRERATTGGKLRGAADGSTGKNVWNLLTVTAQWAASASGQKSPAAPNTTLQLLDYLVQLGYCNYENALLGPVLREYLLAGHKRAAVDEFKRIATEKKRTPLQLEIITLLVELTNAKQTDGETEIKPEEAKTLLSETIKIVSQIHGPVNTNNTLIVALAVGGTEAQLRRMLINPEVRLNHEYILTQCEFLVGSGKLEPVLRLAKCSKGLANVRESDFLQLALVHYVRENNCDAAVQLFQRLLDEGDELKITTEFARKLSDLLEANNFELPTGLQMYLK